MIARLRQRTWGLAALGVIVALATASAIADPAKGRLVDREIRADNIAHNMIGTDPVRKLVLYLPPGYDESATSNVRYPVIYFFPTPAASYRAIFENQVAQRLFDRAIENRVIDKFIFVSIDMNTPLGCSWYVNSPVTGNWEDFMMQELVPYVDANSRTLPARDARGISGDFMGGYGAIRYAMRHPDVFGSVYALGPVGVATDLNPMYGRPDWNLLTSAKSLNEFTRGGFWANIFNSIFQAFLPDPAKPPLFVDLYAHKVGDQFTVDSEIAQRLHTNFLLETMIPQYAQNLKSLRGFKIDWERNDGNPDHVYGNQAFTRKLDEFGIPHEGEEYSSLWGHGVWAENGRVYAEVLPFFSRHFVLTGAR